ncbi:TPR/MLP1/MLP2-like protein-domain-containing protein [Lactarius pseudohatsudake]|nr:TPR/MLP1/MLP2-like protein-domain-containing protein [Lactarius pseudohatsudake]
MHNDIERSSENDRRWLESQIQLLEHQRFVAFRSCLPSDFWADEQCSQDSQTHSSLVKAETTKTYLEQRVEELSRKLQGDAEKLAVYERRSLGVNGAGATHHVSVEGRSREDQLEAEVADLRAALKVAEVDLAAARNHIQQFKEISQASEEALASLSTTHDEYKSTTESQLAASWVCSIPFAHYLRTYSETLQNNLKNAEQELEQARTSLTESKRSFESAREEWLADKKTLEDTIVDFMASEKNLAEDRLTRESDVHAHEERVRAAEERYSREVIAHAEAIKAIEDLKRRIHDLQVSDRNNRTAAETAQAKLSTSEGSWGQQRQALDREIADLAARCKALTKQNNALHQHLDNVSSQATRIRQAADSTIATPGEGDTADGTEAKLSELRAVINYLRKEKEIVDMQLELGKQENARLKTQIGHVTRDLEDTKATLSDERERAASVAATDAQHAELVEKIQQLNLLRESNATLRADSEAHAKRSRELDIKLKSVLQELDPLRDRARTVQAELDARNEHVTRLEEENRRWQERNSQLLSKVLIALGLVFTTLTSRCSTIAWILLNSSRSRTSSRT